MALSAVLLHRDERKLQTPVLVNRWIYSTESWVRKVHCKLNPILPTAIPTLGLANFLHKVQIIYLLDFGQCCMYCSCHVEATGRLSYILFAKVYFGLNWAPLTYHTLLFWLVLCGHMCVCARVHVYICMYVPLVNVRGWCQVSCATIVFFQDSLWQISLMAALASQWSSGSSYFSLPNTGAVMGMHYSTHFMWMLGMSSGPHDCAAY